MPRCLKLRASAAPFLAVAVQALAAAAIPQDMITAVSFTQDSQRLVVGTLKGVVR